MNADALAKLYEQFTARERYSLLIAAGQRDDEVERKRLESSAPLVGRRLLHTHGLAHGMSLLADQYVMRQLELVTWYWRLETLLSDGFLCFNRRESQEHEDRIGPLLKSFAHLFVVHADGWKRFCEEMRIDPDALVRSCPGFATIKDFDETARLLAWSPEEGLAFMRKHHGPETELATAESVARGMQVTLDFHLEWWGMED